MRKFLCVSFFLLSISAFSQGEVKTEIQWLSIERAENFAAEYKNDMLVFFFRNGCPECKKMKAETLKNPEIIKLINENFFPVMLNGRTKDTITYNGVAYYNQQTAAQGKNFRHDLYHELVVGGKHQYVYPYIVVINREHQNVKYLPGFYPAIRLKRSLNQIIK